MQIKPGSASGQTRDKTGKFASDEPLVQITVSNPLTAIRLWISKLLANEGVDVRLKIHPLTVLAAAAIFTAGGFGLGRFVLPAPIIKYIPQLAPQPTPNPWKDTAFSGFLRYSQITKKFYLETAAAEAITLEVPANVILTKYIGRRIFATGRLNTQTGILVVTEATDLELLPTQVTHIPEISPSPPTPTL